MDKVSFYSSDSGAIRINYTGACLSDMVDLHPQFAYIDGLHNYTTHYIDLTDPDNPTPVERPASPVSRSGLTLHDVPEGSTLYISGERYEAEGEVELEFPLPGTFQLRVECFPFLDWMDEVTI